MCMSHPSDIHTQTHSDVYDTVISRLIYTSDTHQIPTPMCMTHTSDAYDASDTRLMRMTRPRIKASDVYDNASDTRLMCMTHTVRCVSDVYETCMRRV